MRMVLAVAAFMLALAVDVRPAPARAVHVAAPWCVIRNTGHAEWICYPTRALCHRYGERPGGGAEYCVQNPA